MMLLRPALSLALLATLNPLVAAAVTLDTPFAAAVLRITVETRPSVVRGSDRACDVTFDGRHGGATGQIAVDFGESQVRTRIGWWAAIPPRGASPTVFTLAPGGRFSEVYRLDLACNAHRRYRFAITASNGAQQFEHTFYYPSEDGFTQETSIDLGALSRFFDWITPAADAEPQPVSIDAVALEGEWVRSESNHDPNDGMKIRVEGDRAVLTFVPETAHSAWREGNTVWREIAADGAVRVLGSDGNYYPGEITAEGPDRLTLAVAHGGAGNDQTWIRAETCWPAAYMAEYEAATPDMWVHFATSLPEGLQAALRAARDAEAPIRTVAVTPSAEWVVVAANRPCYSPGFPAAVREWIDGYIAAGREVDVVSFGSSGRWVVIAQDLMRRSGVPDVVANWVERLQNEDRRVDAFAFTPDAEGAVIVSGGDAFMLGPVQPDGLSEAVAAARTGRRPVHDVAIRSDGSWVLVAGDWYVTRGAPLDLVGDLQRYRTDESRRIDRVVLHPTASASWAIVSNRPEPEPTALPEQMEREMGPDEESIWARMKANDIRSIAVAVVVGNEIAWARGYGLRGGAGPNVHERYVYPNTIFDAASISKPVAAVGALQLVDEGRLRLTRGGVLQDLLGTVVPVQYAALIALLDPRGDVNLARLLSHCAGLDHQHGGSGAQPRDPDRDEVAIHRVIVGLPPAGLRYRAVRSFTPGDSSHYSGANFALVQALIEAHADGGFNQHMRDLFDGLEMFDSSFRPAQDRAQRYAYGYAPDEECNGTCPVYAYPNKAAAGLTTTAMDLARFVNMLNHDGRSGGRVLSETTVAQMLKVDDAVGSSLVEQQCDDPNTMGLGMRVRSRGGDDEMFWHGGRHNGFTTGIYGYPRVDRGIVILMTGDQDDAGTMRSEILSRFLAVYL